MKLNNTIRNCAPKFKNLCSFDWEKLEHTDSERIRHCVSCKRNVFLCETDEETLFHAEQGHCVARPIPDDSELPKTHIYIGQPDAGLPRETHPVIEQQELALTIRNRERLVDNALQNITITSRRCVSCGYPMPFWWKTCRVCGCDEFKDREELGNDRESAQPDV